MGVGQKHAKFRSILDWTTSDFDREYLRNGSRYPKLEGTTTADVDDEGR